MPFEDLVPPEESIKEPTTAEPTQTVPPIIQISPLMNYFDIGLHDRGDSEIQDKLKTIYDWAASQKENPQTSDILWAVKSLENRLGVPEIGSRRYQHILKWIKLQNQISELQKQKESYERNG